MNAQDIRTLVVEPCRQFGVARLDLFGSRARGDAAADSDYDFIVAFDDLTVADASARYFGLLQALGQRLRNPVDLLTYDGLRRQSLRRKIEQERVTVYGC